MQDDDRLEPSQEATDLLLETPQNHAALLDLMPLVYEELRRTARRYLQRERPEHTLQPTALVHEAYLRLIDGERVPWRNRAHFRAIAARTMRSILVDHARARATAKRGGELEKVTMDVFVDEKTTQSVDFVALDEVLERLEKRDPIKRQIVELRYFGGLTIEETAEVLETSPGSVKRHWTSARAWLYRELFGEG